MKKKIGIGVILAMLASLALASVAGAWGPYPYYGGYYYPGYQQGYYQPYGYGQAYYGGYYGNYNCGNGYNCGYGYPNYNYYNYYTPSCAPTCYNFTVVPSYSPPAPVYDCCNYAPYYNGCYGNYYYPCCKDKDKDKEDDHHGHSH